MGSYGATKRTTKVQQRYQTECKGAVWNTDTLPDKSHLSKTTLQKLVFTEKWRHIWHRQTLFDIKDS